MLLYNSGNYFERDEVFFEGLRTGSDFLIVDGMRINGAKNFPLLAIDEAGLKREINYQKLKICFAPTLKSD